MATKPTLAQLKEQFEAAQKAFEEARQSERANALPGVLEQIRLYGFTAAELGLARSAGPKAPAVNIPGGTVLMMNGEVWKSGTKGRKPAWLTDFLANGGDWKTIVAAPK